MRLRRQSDFVDKISNLFGSPHDAAPQNSPAPDATTATPGYHHSPQASQFNYNNDQPSQAQPQVAQPAAQQPAKKLRGRWDATEIATLEQLMAVRPAMTNKEIAAIMGKSANAIYLKRCRKYRGMFKQAHKSDQGRKERRQGGST